MTVAIEELNKIHSMLRKGPTDPERKLHLWRSVMDSAHTPGDVVEVGCFRGSTSVLLKFLMNSYCPHKEFHVYDGFQGLLGKQDCDGEHPVFIDGAFHSTKRDVIDMFAAHSLDLPEIHEGLVQNFQPEDFPNQISLAFIDLDLYEPTKYALELVWPRMAHGGFLIIDDYLYDPTPGIKQAIDEFFADKNVKIHQPANIFAQIRKWA